MNDFEKACEEVNKDYTSEKENVIEWIKDSKVATITFTQIRYISKVRELAAKYPDRVQIVKDNADGTIVAHIPVSAVKINIIERNLSEEQKRIAAERLRFRPRECQSRLGHHPDEQRFIARQRPTFPRDHCPRQLLPQPRRVCLYPR